MGHTSVWLGWLEKYGSGGRFDMLVAFQQFVALLFVKVTFGSGASRLLVWRGVAQLVEHWFPKPAVAGSSPSAPASL